MKQIPFNIPTKTGLEMKYLNEVYDSNKHCGDGVFSKRCEDWFQKNLGIEKTLMTSSCTHSLEMAALILNLGVNDEVIMSSYTFVSTANAFALRGVKIKFVDIRPDTMNIDESKIESAITNRTKAIVVMHYAGISCEMGSIKKIAEKYKLILIEDAAQGIFSKYNGQFLGTIGDIGTFSFHETKNFTSAGEGGLTLIRNKRFIEESDIIREKGTNRSKFIHGIVDKYTWVNLGSSYLPTEFQCCYLLSQLENKNEILQTRLELWDLYNRGFSNLNSKGFIELMTVPTECEHNAHMFYIKTNNYKTRASLMDFLKKKGINTTFHYIPLHTSNAGKKFGEFIGLDIHTTKESERLLRLPIYHNLEKSSVKKVIDQVNLFFEN